MDAARHADPTRLRKLLQARRYVDTVAEDVLILDDDLTDVDTHTEVDALVGWHSGIAFGHATLHLDRAAHGIYNASEFQEKTVAGGLDNPTVVFGNLRVNKVPPVGLQSRQGATVVTAHEHGIARHI